MRFFAPLGVAIPLAVLASVGCSSTDAPPTASPEASTGCQSYVPPTTYDAAAPVSFTDDVMPIILRSCAFTSCHGAVGGPTGGMYLGPELALTYQSTVGAPSTIEPSVLRIKPGDPAGSFLQHKIDGDACTLASCSSRCAELMPQGSDLMAVNDRLTFRAWIAQGALADFDAGAPDAGGE